MGPRSSGAAQPEGTPQPNRGGSMRRLLLLMLPLTLAALALPVASASAANTVNGVCNIGGSAHFTPNGLQATPQTLGYNFSGTGTCSGTLNGVQVVNAPVTAN